MPQVVIVMWAKCIVVLCCVVLVMVVAVLLVQFARLWTKNEVGRTINFLVQNVAWACFAM